jgi:hypothetical protein
MRRPIGVTILAALSFLAALANLWRVGVYLGWFKFNIGGAELYTREANWAAALWALLIAAIWVWVAVNFWNMRAVAWQFGVFISLFTLIWGFFALLFGSSVQAETVPWLLAGAIYIYLMWPGVREAFANAEMSRMTPEQKAAIEQLQKANEAAGQAPPPGMTPPAS